MALFSSVLPISSSPALENVAAAALRERRLRLEAITQVDETFRSRNDTLPNNNSQVAAVQAGLLSGDLQITATDLFLAQLYSQQPFGEETDIGDTLSIDSAALSDPSVIAAFNQQPYLNVYSAPITPYGTPILQNFLV